MRTAFRCAVIAVVCLLGASGRSSGEPVAVAQDASYLPCYKQVGMKMVQFRWCPPSSPWTATNESRTSCYATSEACAQAEMPQSWCIKCGPVE